MANANGSTVQPSPDDWIGSGGPLEIGCDNLWQSVRDERKCEVGRREKNCTHSYRWMPGKVPTYTPSIVRLMRHFWPLSLLVRRAHRQRTGAGAGAGVGPGFDGAYGSKT